MVKVLLGKAFVLVKLFLPISLAGWIGEFRFGLFGAFSKRSKGSALVGSEFLLVFMQGIITNDRLAMTVGNIKLAVAREATLQFG